MNESTPAQVGDINIAPTTTAAQDMVTHGQRRINLIWETTQASIAIAVCLSTLYVAAALAVAKDAGAFLLLSNVFFLVVGTYFNRTNHTAVGGVTADKIGR